MFGWASYSDSLGLSCFVVCVWCGAVEWGCCKVGLMKVSCNQKMHFYLFQTIKCSSVFTKQSYSLIRAIQKNNLLFQERQVQPRTSSRTVRPGSSYVSFVTHRQPSDTNTKLVSYDFVPQDKWLAWPNNTGFFFGYPDEMVLLAGVLDSGVFDESLHLFARELRPVF